MSGSRLLIDVISSWHSCEDASGDVRRGEVSKDDELLARTIENQIIPRLMLSHRISSPRMGESRGRKIDEADVNELARLVVEHDEGVAFSYVQTLIEQGATVDSVFMELLAQTARRLGEWWSSDQCDFTDVTIGLSRLQQICHQLSPSFESGESPASEDYRILLSTVPGEQHTLGLMLVEECFRRSGWECCSIAPNSVSELVKTVKRQRFDVIGISVSCGVLLEGVASAIQAVRKASINGSATILVGGSIFLEHPEYAARVGADGTAQDGRQAIIQLRTLLRG